MAKENVPRRAVSAQSWWLPVGQMTDTLGAGLRAWAAQAGPTQCKVGEKVAISRAWVLTAGTP